MAQLAGSGTAATSSTTRTPGIGCPPWPRRRPPTWRLNEIAPSERLNLIGVYTHASPVTKLVLFCLTAAIATVGHRHLMARLQVTEQAELAPVSRGAALASTIA